ncbi:unnamed protein product [Arctogadus glacialis]
MLRSYNLPCHCRVVTPPPSPASWRGEEVQTPADPRKGENKAQKGEEVGGGGLVDIVVAPFTEHLDTPPRAPGDGDGDGGAGGRGGLGPLLKRADLPLLECVMKSIFTERTKGYKKKHF